MVRRLTAARSAVVVVVFAALVAPASASHTVPEEEGRIVFEGAASDGRNSSQALRGMNEDGSNATTLALNGSAPAFATDGRRIFFDREYGKRTEDEEYRTAVVRMGSDGRGQKRLGQPTSFYEKSPSVSPDGRTIVYSGDRGLHLMAADGTDRRLVTSGANAFDSDPAFSPDGDLVAFSRGYTGVRLPEIWVMDANGAGERSLGIAGSNPQFSPNGATIVFDAPRSESSRTLHDVFAMSSDGTNARRLTHEGSNSQPAFSPDGRMIVFVRDHRIHTMHSDGSHVSAPLTNGESPAWGRGTRIDEPQISGPRASKARVTRRTRVTLRRHTVTCDGYGGDCRVRVTLTKRRIRVGGAFLVIRAGSERRLSARLNRYGRGAVRGQGTVDGRLKVAVNRSGWRSRMFKLAITASR